MKKAPSKSTLGTKRVTLTLEQLRAKLQALKDSEGLVKAAGIIGVDFTTLHRFLASDSRPPPRMVKALRAEADTQYTMPAREWLA